MALRVRAWLFVASLALLIQPLARGEAPAARPQWLAVDRLADGAAVSRSFRLAAVQSASLRFAGDFCRARISINGEPFADVEPYCQTHLFDVTNVLRLGENRITLALQPLPGAPAVAAATLTIMQADGSRQAFSTDESWIMTNAAGDARAATCRGPVPEELWGIGRRDIAIDPFENYEQWQQAIGGDGKSPRFFVAPGFEVTQLRVAEPDQGSWISLAVDARGRLTIGREDQGFLRMTIADDGQSIAQIQTIPADLLECRGLVYHDGWLYANANNSKQLFRLQLSKDGAVEQQTMLRELPGGVGHGRNDLAIQGDSLLMICGDSLELPRDNMLDPTSPLRTPLAGSSTREGALLRTSLDGRRWELLSAGLRNPYGIATHPETGDPFTYDADNEYDLGMPWYRPTRVLQLLPGGDFGYREATGRLPPRFADQADNAPPLFDVGRGSPTAVIFGRQFRFPRPYRDALFVLDWTYGRVIALHLAERGASYRAAAELFLQGRPLNVTDVAAGRDGAMYLITGGRKTQSALYRVAARAAPDAVDAVVDSTERALLDEIREYGRRQRELARQFQAHEPAAVAPDPATCQRLLVDPDPVVRYAARTALERIAASEWTPWVLDRSRGAASLRGLMAAARALDPAQTATIVDRLLSVAPANLPIDQRLVWLRDLELCSLANPQAVLALQSAIEPMILSGWQAGESPQHQLSAEGSNADYRRRAALLLRTLGSPRLPELAARDLLSSPVQEDQILGLMALRDQRAGWTPGARQRQLETLAAMPGMVGGEGLPFFHAWLERETLIGLSPTEQAQYAAQQAALAKFDPLPPTRPIVQKWTLGDLTEVADDASLGDAQRGSAIFRDALCARCHRCGERGPSIGPDLTFVAGRFSRHDILDSVLNPSKAVAENYRSVTVQMTDGRVVTGRLAAGGDFRAETVRLIPDALRPDQSIELDKKRIESHQSSDRSPMPEGLLDSFTRREIADLLAHLAGGRGRTAASQ